MAAAVPYMEILSGIVCLFFVFLWFKTRNSTVMAWPVLGMLPSLLWNHQRLHDYISHVLKQSGGTFKFRGPWFSGYDYVATCDPVNMHHIMSKRFSNYQIGSDLSVLFDPLFGKGLMAADYDSWKFQSKMVHSYLHDTKFQPFLEKTVQERVVNCLIPVLDHVCVNKMEVDLDDVLLRSGFDISCLVFLGRDPKCLSVDFPEVACERAFHDMEEALVHRIVVPDKYWKLLEWLQIGPEKKLSKGLKILDGFIYECISIQREKYLRSISEKEENQTGFDFLTACLMQEDTIREGDAGGGAQFDKFLRDLTTNLLIAGRDTSSATLSRFFWLLAMNPTVEARILQEMRDNFPEKGHIFGADELDKLVYLHATLCETLRLYPSVPVNPRCAMQPDTLPSGLHVKKNTKFYLYFYAMGRMEEIWGKDCNEFRPERWISADGRIMHVASYNFTSFGAGPRKCLGKDMSFVQMKIVATTIIMKYQLQLVQGHPVVSSTSLILHMKHGLKVRVTKRSV